MRNDVYFQLQCPAQLPSCLALSDLAWDRRDNLWNLWGEMVVIVRLRQGCITSTSTSVMFPLRQWEVKWCCAGDRDAWLTTSRTRRSPGWRWCRWGRGRRQGRGCPGRWGPADTRGTPARATLTIIKKPHIICDRGAAASASTIKNLLRHYAKW